MNTIDIIQCLTAVTQQTGPTGGLPLTHGTPAEQNFEAENATFPKIYVDEPLSSRGIIGQGGGMQTVYEVKLFFADKAVLDATPQQQRPIIMQQRAYAKEFITRLQQFTYNDGRKMFNLQSGAEIRLTDVVNLPFDVGLTGVFVEMDLPVFDYNSICVV